MVSIYPLENFIPEDVLKEQEYIQISKKIVRVLLGLIVLILFLGTSIWFMYYYIQNSRDQDVPENIKNEYNRSVKFSALLENKNSIMIKAANEDRQVVPVIASLLTAKPGEIGLTKIDITGTATKEVLVEGFALDPERFNFYVASVNSNNSVLVNASVDKITSNSNGYKVVLIKATQIK